MNSLGLKLNRPRQKLQENAAINTTLIANTEQSQIDYTKRFNSVDITAQQTTKLKLIDNAEQHNLEKLLNIPIINTSSFSIIHNDNQKCDSTTITIPSNGHKNNSGNTKETNNNNNNGNTLSNMSIDSIIDPDYLFDNFDKCFEIRYSSNVPKDNLANKYSPNVKKTLNNIFYNHDNNNTKDNGVKYNKESPSVFNTIKEDVLIPIENKQNYLQRNHSTGRSIGRPITSHDMRTKKIVLKPDSKQNETLELSKIEHTHVRESVKGDRDMIGYLFKENKNCLNGTRNKFPSINLTNGCPKQPNIDANKELLKLVKPIINLQKPNKDNHGVENIRIKRTKSINHTTNSLFDIHRSTFLDTTIGIPKDISLKKGNNHSNDNIRLRKSFNNGTNGLNNEFIQELMTFGIFPQGCKNNLYYNSNQYNSESQYNQQQHINKKTLKTHEKENSNPNVNFYSKNSNSNNQSSYSNLNTLGNTLGIIKQKYDKVVIKENEKDHNRDIGKRHNSSSIMNIKLLTIDDTDGNNNNMRKNMTKKVTLSKNYGLSKLIEQQKQQEQSSLIRKNNTKECLQKIDSNQMIMNCIRSMNLAKP